MTRGNGFEFPGEGSTGFPSELTQDTLARVENTAFNNAEIFPFKLQSALDTEWNDPWQDTEWNDPWQESP